MEKINTRSGTNILYTDSDSERTVLLSVGREELFTSANDTPFAYELSREGEHVVVTIHGELDMGTAPELDACLHRLRVQRVEHATVVLADVTFCDSSGLGVFLRSRNEWERAGATLGFRSPSQCVRRLFEVTNTDQLLTQNDRPAPRPVLPVPTRGPSH